MSSVSSAFGETPPPPRRPRSLADARAAYVDRMLSHKRETGTMEPFFERLENWGSAEASKVSFPAVEIIAVAKILDRTLKADNFVSPWNDHDHATILLFVKKVLSASTA